MYAGYKQVPLPSGSASYYNPLPIIDYNIEPGAIGILNTNVISADSILIDGVNVKRWNGVNIKTGQQCFVQAYAIGSQLGILNSNYYITGNVGQVKSLDFIYKSDSFHYDFDIKTTWP